MLDMKRRECIALVGGGLLFTAKVKRTRAQQPANRPFVNASVHFLNGFDYLYNGRRLRELC